MYNQTFSEMFEAATTVEEKIQLAMNLEVIVAQTIEIGDTVRDIKAGGEWIVTTFRDDMGGCDRRGRMYRISNGVVYALRFADEMELVAKTELPHNFAAVFTPAVVIANS